MNLKDISEKPTCIKNIHESCYRSYHILNLAIEMVNRNDSKETINQIVGYLNDVKEPDNKRSRLRERQA